MVLRWVDYKTGKHRSVEPVLFWEDNVLKYPTPILIC